MSGPPPYGPLSLLAASLLPVLGATAIHSGRHGVVCVAVLVAVTPFVVSDWRPTLWRAALGLVAAASIAVSTWLYGGRDLDVSLGAATRVLYMILPGAVLTAYLDPSTLGDHLAQRLRLPPRAVVASTAAMERLESLGQHWQQIGRARRARGVGADGGLVHRTRVSAAMAFALLVSTMRMSGSMSLAMDARGFATAHRRTWAEPAPWRLRDSLILAAGLALAALPWLLLLPAAGAVVGVR